MRAPVAVLIVLATLAGEAGAREPAAGLALVAARATGNVFRHSVVYLLDHGAEGTLGLIINRPTDTRLEDVIPRLGAMDARGHLVGYGGPVGLDGLKFLVRSTTTPEDAVGVAEGVYASASPQLLERLLREDVAPEDLRIFVGYAGWAPGQLAAELRRGVWYVQGLSREVVFDAGPQLWQRLIEQLDPPGIRAARPPARIGAAGDAPPARAGAPPGQGNRAPAGALLSRCRAGQPAPAGAEAFSACALPRGRPLASTMEVSELVNSG